MDVIYIIVIGGFLGCASPIVVRQGEGVALSISEAARQLVKSRK